jgi:hypothetical protein
MKRRRKKSIDEGMREWLKLEARPLINAARGKEELNWFNQQLVALVESDEPLTPFDRQRIADELRRYYSSSSYAPHPAVLALSGRHFNDQQILHASKLKQELQDHCGLTAIEAEQDVAEELGISVDALRKRFQRELPGALDRQRQLDRLKQSDSRQPDRLLEIIGVFRTIAPRNVQDNFSRNVHDNRKKRD